MKFMDLVGEWYEVQRLENNGEISNVSSVQLWGQMENRLARMSTGDKERDLEHDETN